MSQIKFEVGRCYYDELGYLKKCTKRTDISVWMGDTRYNITNRCGDVERTKYHTADNYDDVEVQRDRAINELLKAATKVCDNEPAECIYGYEEDIYKLCKELKSCIEEYKQSKTTMSEVEQND